MNTTAAVMLDRAMGAYLGVAIGDALGATVEFCTEAEIQRRFKVHQEIIGGGWLGLKPGRVTDDTEMSLALGSAVIASDGWNLKAIAEAFVHWMRGGPIDVGNTCRRGLRRYMLDGTLCAPPRADDGGNGAAMRNLPAVLASLHSEEACVQRSIEQAHVTHHQAESDEAVAILARMTRLLILGGGIEECAALVSELIARAPAFQFQPWPGRAGGYIVDTMQAVFDGFFNTATFEDCLVRVVNRGDDADTTGAIAGSLAGALYGAAAIPARWLGKLDPAVTAAIRAQTPRLLQIAFPALDAALPPLHDAFHMRPPSKLYHPNIETDDSRSASSINRCNVPPWLIGSEEFQANPRPIEIDGVRTTDGQLFRLLKKITDPEERSGLFHAYIASKFSPDEDDPAAKAKTFQNYVHYFRAWGADSNGHAGAVLKAWVESRFGLLATYHGGRLADNDEAREKFTLDRMRGASKSMGVLMQLDLLYTFCQDELRRRFPHERWTTLYRGTHDPEEYSVRSGHDAPGVPGKPERTALVQLNNLSSFTSDAEVAWEFGSRAWEVKVPMSKIVFFSGLFPDSLLMGESEYLVLGGYYNVRSLLF